MSLTRRVFAERRAVILPLLVFLIASGVALGAVFWLQGSIDAAKGAGDQAILNLDFARRTEKAAKDGLASKQLAEIQLKKFYAEILPKDQADAVNVTNFWLGRIAASSRVTYHAGQYDHAPVRDSRLMKLTGEITLVGEYADIRRFLYEVETAQEFVIIEKVALSQPNSVQGNSQLEVSLSVATYFLAEPLPGVVSK